MTVLVGKHRDFYGKVAEAVVMPLAKRWGLSSMLGYLIAGVLGPLTGLARLDKKGTG